MRIARVYKKEAVTDTDAVDLTLLDPLISKYKGKKGNVIPLLQGAQELYGFIPRAAFERISA